MKTRGKNNNRKDYICDEDENQQIASEETKENNVDKFYGYADEQRRQKRSEMNKNSNQQQKQSEQELDDLQTEIKQILQSVFRTKNIPNIRAIVTKSKQLIVSQITKLVTTTVNRHCLLTNKSSLHLKQILIIVSDFGQIYRNKVVRSLLIEGIQSASATGNGNGS